MRQQRAVKAIRWVKLGGALAVSNLEPGLGEFSRCFQHPEQLLIELALRGGWFLCNGLGRVVTLLCGYDSLP